MSTKISRRDLASYVSTQILQSPDLLRSVALRLAAYLIESRRTDELSLIVRDINFNLANAGTVLGRVISASKLSDDVRQSIEGFINQRQLVKYLSLDEEVDPLVLGGIKIELPGQELDTTILKQLSVLKTKYHQF